MISPNLRFFSKLMIPVLFVISVIATHRGHNLPGGGFIGSLIYAVCYCLMVFSFGVKQTKEFLPFDPRSLIGIGLLVAMASSLVSLLEGKDFFTAKWWSVDLYYFGPRTFGTPQFFDMGVYLVVSGAVMIIVNAFEED